MTATYREAVDAFIADAEGGGWAALPFFRDGSAASLAARLDAMVAAGDHVLPGPGDLFSALRLTPAEAARVVILGQDPYPTPGDAHGLAFSVRPGVRIPRSLSNIFKELQADTGVPSPTGGNLQAWAQQGVLLLNTCLTVAAGQAGSHRQLGWQVLTDQVIATAAEQPGRVFLLWGADAQAKRPLIGGTNHLVIETAHPSPLSARRGFLGSRPFSRANDYLVAKGMPAIDWRLP